MRTDALLRSTSVRLSLVYAGLLITAFVSVGVLIWFAARNTAETELREDIELEVTAIEIELESEGLAAAIAAIKARAEHPDGRISYDHDGSENLTDSFAFSVDDGAGLASSGTFAITVTPVSTESCLKSLMM